MSNKAKKFSRLSEIETRTNNIMDWLDRENYRDPTFARTIAHYLAEHHYYMASVQIAKKKTITKKDIECWYEKSVDRFAVRMACQPGNWPEEPKALPVREA